MWYAECIAEESESDQLCGRSRAFSLPGRRTLWLPKGPAVRARNKMGIFGKQKAPAEPKMTLELDYPANFAYVGEVEVFLVDGSSEASHGRLAQGQTRSALS